MKIQMVIPKSKANALLKDLNVKDLIGIPLEGIANYLGIFYEAEPLTGAQGNIIFGKKSCKITVSTTVTNPFQKRFIIAHELGHYSLHKNVMKRFFSCDEKSFVDYHAKGGHEVEANEFASELLMPSKLFKEFSFAKPFSVQLVQEISSHFESSITATSIKYADYGHEPIAVILSKGGKVAWVRVNDRFPVKFIAIKQAVPSTSVAASFFTTGNIPPRCERVNIFDWFYQDFNIEKNLDLKLVEQCWPVRSINGVLSFLWIK
jgi:hypothetical protein